VQLDWERLVRRYVFDETKTPYFVAVARLNRAQARSELFVYVLFLTVLLGTIGVASLSPALPHGGALGVSIYAFAVVGAALAFGFTRHYAAAAFCATAPVAALLYFAVYGFHANLAVGDRVLLVVFALLWLAYGWRVLRIAKAYPVMPEPEPPG
jgi:hypothetical protein